MPRRVTFPDGHEAACGWRQEYKFQGGDVGQVLYWIVPPNSTKLGWYDTEKETVYLLPDAALFGGVPARPGGENSLPSKHEMYLHLFKSGKLARTEATGKGEIRGRIAVRVSLEKRQQSVIAVKASAFWPEEPESETRAKGDRRMTVDLLMHELARRGSRSPLRAARSALRAPRHAWESLVERVGVQGSILAVSQGTKGANLVRFPPLLVRP
jgi:hypothetical protein